MPSHIRKASARRRRLHEIKHDGFRVIARRDGKRVKLYSRPGNDLTGRFTRIVDAVARLKARTCIIDGEAVACGPDGIALFDLIRYWRHDERSPRLRSPGGLPYVNIFNGLEWQTYPATALTGKAFSAHWQTGFVDLTRQCAHSARLDAPLKRRAGTCTRRSGWSWSDRDRVCERSTDADQRAG